MSEVITREALERELYPDPDETEPVESEINSLTIEWDGADWYLWEDIEQLTFEQSLALWNTHLIGLGDMSPINRAKCLMWTHNAVPIEKA